MSEALEDSLNGGYRGLYGEVVTADCYRISHLPFVPDRIFDIGANVGIFTRYAGELFPEALIVSVEPNPENFKLLAFNPPKNNTASVCINKAIGRGQVYHGLTAANGSGETYLNAGLGYPKEMMDADTSVEKSDVETILLEELISIKEGLTYLVKIDIEGNEKEIFTHEPSMEILRKCDYICIEVHFFAQVGGDIYDDMVQTTMEALKSFEDTHYIELDNVNFFAIKKKYGDYNLSWRTRIQETADGEQLP